MSLKSISVHTFSRNHEAAFSNFLLISVLGFIQGTQYQISLLGEIATEKGLDVQNYQCGSCKRPVGLSKSRLHFINLLVHLSVFTGRDSNRQGFGQI